VEAGEGVVVGLLFVDLLLDIIDVSKSRPRPLCLETLVVVRRSRLWSNGFAELGERD
jgi:hypothetical protein